MIDAPFAGQSTRLARAPLVLALCQIRFSPVLRMPDWIVAIQDKLGGLGFLRFEKSQIQSFTVVQGEPPKIESSDRWDFLNREKKTGVSLTSSFVVLQTSEYATFKEFSETLKQVLRVLEVEARIDIVDRIGLRYVDFIQSRSGSYTDYLAPSLAGFPFADLGDPLIHRSFSNIQAVAETTDGRTLVVRCFPTNGGQFLPPDLAPSPLRFDVDVRPEQSGAILDFDHFAVVDIDFDVTNVVRRIDGLHQLASEAFRHAVSEHAMTSWGAPA
jgi:uncharacterized protein (TIGR04255 family)